MKRKKTNPETNAIVHLTLLTFFVLIVSIITQL
jgi:hypothetical protein